MLGGVLVAFGSCCGCITPDARAAGVPPPPAGGVAPFAGGGKGLPLASSPTAARLRCCIWSLSAPI